MLVQHQANFCLILAYVICIFVVQTQCEVEDSATLTDFTCQEWYCKNKQDPHPFSHYYFPRKYHCFCDDLCSFYDDCCVDADNSTQKHIDRDMYNYMKCTTICGVSTWSHIQVVVECPRGYLNKETADLCTAEDTNDAFRSIPVTGRKTGLMYRNIYCAQCHGEEADFWIPNVKCPNNYNFSLNFSLTFNEILSHPKCVLVYQQLLSAPAFRPCFQHVIETCPEDNLLISKQCKDCRHKLVYSNEKIYKSPQIAACNNESTPGCIVPRKFNECGSKSSVFGFYSFSILFNINTGVGTKEAGLLRVVKTNFKINIMCNGDEIFDPFIGKCRPIVCSLDFVMHLNQCVPILSLKGKISTTLNDTILNDTDALSHDRNLSDCPRVTLNEDEYTVLRDGRLQERASQIVHEKHDIVMNGTDALVCISSRKSHSESLKRFLITRKDVSSIEGIISGIGTILSLVSLLMTIVVYATLRKLRNVPGCNVLSLSVALFIAEVLMLTAPETEGCYIVCKSISVAMHYFFLAAFIWMNVIAHDVWSTFTRVMNAANVSKKPSTRYVTYSMYAWLTPLLLTIPGLTLDLTFPDSQYAPGYGDGICWFSKKLGLLVFFATPLALIVTLNIFFFTMTVANICLVKRTSARRLGPDYRNQFAIYIKLFLVMGLTWVLGFLSAFVPHPVTTYLYITLNTLQGLFIGVSFVCTWKVLHLLREYFSRGKYAISRSTATQVPNYTVTYM